MKEKSKMFSRTKTAIEHRLAGLRGKLDENASGLRVLDWDGDMMDDPLMLRLHDDHERIKLDEAQLKYYLGTAEIIDEQKARDSDRVVLGSRVRLFIDSASDGQELMVIRVGSVLDKRFLEEENGELILSDESPLISSIMGKKANEESEYNSVNGKNRVKILSLLQ